jgi:hypothetical protein
MKALRRIQLLTGGCVLMLTGAMPAAAQTQRQSQPQPSDPIGAQNSSPRPTNTPIVPPQQQLPPLIPGDTAGNDSRLERDQARLRNVDRQRQIVADTQKLVELANQLNAAVEKSNKDTLSLEVIRKADEIEKLAKSVREKMKGS